MSSPAIPPSREGATSVAEPVREGVFMRWHRRLWSILLILLALQLGLFLLMFPWRPEWEMNWVALHSRSWSDLWMNYYFRGGVSGLGALNIFVAGAEFSRQIRALITEKK